MKRLKVISFANMYVCTTFIRKELTTNNENITYCFNTISSLLNRIEKEEEEIYQKQLVS
jgi:hypothetical protein